MENKRKYRAEKMAEIQKISMEKKQSIEDKLRELEEKEGRTFSPKQFMSIRNSALIREIKNIKKHYRIKEAIEDVLLRCEHKFTYTLHRRINATCSKCGYSASRTLQDLVASGTVN